MATILIVDDHILNRQFLTALLGFDHHELLVAIDGAEGLAIARAQRPALIITDILMPNMNGFEFIRRMRAEPEIADTPVIFYTSSYSTREAGKLARACGVRWVLRKPSAPELILRTVHEALGLGGAEPDPVSEAPGPRLAAIDRQLTAYLDELETSGQLMSQLGAGGAPQSAATAQITQRFTQSLTDFQSVGLRLTALIDMSIEMVAERDPLHLLETACRVARHIAAARYAAVGIVDEGGAKLRHFTLRGLEPDQWRRLPHMAPAAGALGELLAGRGPLRRSELDGDPQTLGLPPWHPPVHSFLGVPIASAGRSYGWIYLVDKSGAEEFSEIDERAVATVATQLAVAYENLSLYAEIQANVAQLQEELAARQRITDQLADSDARFRQLAENIHEVFFLIDTARAEMLYISPAYEAIWGHSCASLYAKPDSWMDAVHPDDRAQLGAEHGRDGAFDQRYRIVRPDGEIRWIHARGFPVRDPNGVRYRLAGVAADITQQMQLQQSLREREAGLQRAQLVARMAHVVTGEDGAFQSWSATLPQLIGRGAIPDSGRTWLDIVEPGDRARLRQTCIDAGRAGQRRDLEYQIRRADGELIQLHHVMEPLEGSAGDGERMRWFNTLQDVTEQREQQRRISRLSQIYAVQSGVNSAIVRLHERDELLQEACRVAVGQGAFSMAWAAVVDPVTLEGKVVACCGGEPGYVDRIVLHARPDGADSARPACVALRERRQVICNDIGAELALAPLRAQLLAGGHRALAVLPLMIENRVAALISLFADELDFFAQPDRRKLLDELAGDLSFGLQSIDKEERLNYLAYYDVLTGLPNGMLFNDRLAQFLHAAAGADDPVAAIVINLDHFVQLNDALGRHAGDTALKTVAQRLTLGLREPCSVARIGGDTFAVAVGALQHGADAAALLEQHILQPLAQPFMVGQQEVRLSVRAGIALYPGDGRDAETLFKHAEVALKKAKSGGERYLFYAPKMNVAMAARMAMESSLRVALEAHEFEMHYQPRVDLPSGQIVSAEALIRWNHPQRGLIAPDEFITLAEETGLISPIGDWVIDAVCAQQALWRADQVRIVPVAINLSAVQLKKGKMQQTIREAMARHGLEPEHIEFELTESVVMDEPEQAICHLQELKNLGVQLSLDDFGTGYSSLAYLKRFPFDFVKIDRAFITDITDNPEDAAIATAVIAMAHSLGLRVVAEGVEMEGQLRFLRKHSCDELQGYYFSRPVPADAFETMLRECKQMAHAL
jgi:diguanylate cyclase (GGDEF)-like protein/PAS domain S-box-containing protein